MTNISDEELLKLNCEGIIPGPGETEEVFLLRAKYCLSLKKHLADELKDTLGAIEEDVSPILERPLQDLQALYDCAPSWIPIFFSNYRLPFWHGGCAWIFQITEKSPTAAFIQLRKKICSQSIHLGIYTRDELLMHEMTHVGRMAFNEPKYEEILAYKTSKSPFRRWIGGIVQSSIESVIFILLLFIIVVFDVFLISLGRGDAYFMSLWLKLIPLTFIAYGLFRIFKKQQTLSRCIENLNFCNAYAVAFRLTDAEIERFSQSTPGEIMAYAKVAALKELRFRLIWQAYLKK